MEFVVIQLTPEVTVQHRLRNLMTMQASYGMSVMNRGISEELVGTICAPVVNEEVEVEMTWPPHVEIEVDLDIPIDRTEQYGFEFAIELLLCHAVSEGSSHLHPFEGSKRVALNASPVVDLFMHRGCHTSLHIGVPA